MLTQALRGARHLDQELNGKLGRPYHVVLSMALIGEIVHRFQEFLDLPYNMAHLGELILPFPVGLALLIHQLGEMSERMENRNANRQRGRAQVRD